MRILGLDQLRGLCAASIMLMHYYSLMNIPHDATTFLGRIGFYGVDIFYILSGLSLYTVHHDKPLSAPELKLFYTKRVFRIFPLLWLVIIYNILRGSLISGDSYPLSQIFLNLTGLFGFVAWDEYIGVGTWSIGNEIVFYACFPLLMAASKRPWIFMSILAASFIATCMFSFHLQTLDASEIWSVYTNPVNHLFYFIAGIAIGRFGDLILSRSSSVLWLLLAASVLLFVLYPVTGSEYTVIKGLYRVLFTLPCIGAVLFFYRQRFSAPRVLDTFLVKLGEASYSVYLLHPIVLSTLTLVLARIHVSYEHPAAIIIPSVILTLLISYIVFITFEKYFIRLGKKLASALIRTHETES
jgi:exopolysaccharide production protein ExoZ